MEVFQCELQLFNIAEPLLFAGGLDPGVQVHLDNGEPVGLRWVNLQETATHTCVFVGAARSVRAYAATEFDLPPAKVLTEFLEFLSGRLAVLLDGSFGAAPGHKLLVVLNDLSGVGRRVATGGVQVVFWNVKR